MSLVNGSLHLCIFPSCVAALPSTLSLSPSAQFARFRGTLNPMVWFFISSAGLSTENTIISRGRFFTFASSDDGSGVSSNSDTGSYVEIELEETRSKLNASFQLSEAGVDYTQSLHEAARKFQLAAEQHESLRKNGWFSKSWLGVDQISWIKPVSYQAS